MAKENDPVLRQKLPYRNCVGCVLFNKDGKVFIGQRIAGGQGALAHSWQFPQGGIDRDEEPLDAALRELYEETSVRSVSLLKAAPNWIFYDLPDELVGVALKGKYRGQRQKWFAFLFEGNEHEINVAQPANGTHPAEFSSWKWCNLDAVVNLIVPFKREAYQKVVASFHDIPSHLDHNGETSK